MNALTIIVINLFALLGHPDYRIREHAQTKLFTIPDAIVLELLPSLAPADPEIVHRLQRDRRERQIRSLPRRTSLAVHAIMTELTSVSPNTSELTNIVKRLTPDMYYPVGAKLEEAAKRQHLAMRGNLDWPTFFDSTFYQLFTPADELTLINELIDSLAADPTTHLYNRYNPNHGPY